MGNEDFEKALLSLRESIDSRVYIANRKLSIKIALFRGHLNCQLLCLEEISKVSYKHKFFNVLIYNKSYRNVGNYN